MKTFQEQKHGHEKENLVFSSGFKEDVMTSTINNGIYILQTQQH